MRCNRTSLFVFLLVILISSICFGCSKNQIPKYTPGGNDIDSTISEIKTGVNDTNNIFLSNQEVDIIKTAYLEEKKDWYFGLGVSAENFEILHCLGKAENKYVVIIRGDHVAELVTPEYPQRYFIYCESPGKILSFNYLPEQISVINQEVYYTLQDAYNLSIISDSELMDIFNNFSKINSYDSVGVNKNSEITDDLTMENLNELDKTESNNIDDAGHRTGPSSIFNSSSFDFITFSNYFKDLNMNNYSFVSFDLENSVSVGTKKYFYGTNQPIDNFDFNPENYSYSIQYEFYSNDYPIGSNIDNLSYKIECYDIQLINNYTDNNFIFKLVNKKDTILFFDLLLNDYCIMKIKIDLENNYTSNDVKEIILLLESNIVIIR